MRRWILALGAALGAGGVAWAARRHQRWEEVAPELRHPVLHLPLSVNDRLIRATRPLMSRIEPPVGPCEGVEREGAEVPATDDRPALRLAVYRPTAGTGDSGAEVDGKPARRGALLWIHGGGYVIGSPEQDHDLCCRLVAEAGVVVVATTYRLAPEHPFPAGLDDCLAALRWLHTEADALGVDPNRVAVGGSSAGGGLAAALAQRALDEGGPPICFQLLHYPMLDDRTALRADLDAPLWSNRSNHYGWSAYLGHPVEEGEERAHAVPARREHLAGLPPARIGVGSVDLFHGEDAAYARRLDEAGVPCQLHEVPGMYHGADYLMPTAPSMVDFRDRMVAAVATACGQAPAAADGSGAG